MHESSEHRYLVNKTYEEIRVGDTSSLSLTLMPEDVKLFAVLTGDMNPGMADQHYSESGMFREVIAHGMWSGSLISTVLGTQFPGPGTILIDQSLHFARPVTIGDTITITVTAKQKFDHNKHVILDCVCTNQEGLQVVRGTAEVLAPSEKISHIRQEHMPSIRIDDKHERYMNLLASVKGLEPIPTAVAHHCDVESLKGPVIAFQEGIIEPFLIGPESKIRSVAEEFGIDLHGIRIVNSKHSHDSAALAVSMVRTGDAEALMKGSLHTDELMGAVVRRDTGLRTARRVSHCFVMDVPSYSETLIVTDAAVNIAPTLKEKVDIIQNAIDLAHDLQFDEVRVALLSAMETINTDVPSTIEAGALCKMADRGQITGAILDGPLALDNAISLESVAIKKIDSPVAGRANVLVVPDLEAGNMLAKSLSFLAGADAAGIVLGARVPIILTSRADSVKTRLASCAVAVMVASARRENAAKMV